MELPFLSVALGNYNHGKYIRQALDAIVSQSVKPLELVVIDDASTDDSVSIIQEFVDRYPFVRLIKNAQNKGCINNANYALSLLRGEYIYFASADDMVLPGFFEKSLRLLARYPEAGLCSTLTVLIDKDNHNKGLWPLPIISLRQCYVNPKKAFKLMYKNIFWTAGVSVILKRKYTLEAGGFNLKHHYLADAFVSHYISLKYGVCFIPEPLVTRRRLDGEYSDTRNQLDLTRQIIDNFSQSMKEIPEIFPAKYIQKCCDIEMITCYWNSWLLLLQNWLGELSKLCKKNGYLNLFFFWMTKAALSCASSMVLIYLFVVYRNIFFNLVRGKLKYYLIAPFIPLNLPPNIKK